MPAWHPPAAFSLARTNHRGLSTLVSTRWGQGDSTSDTLPLRRIASSSGLSPFAYAAPLLVLALLRTLIHVGLCDDAYISLRVAQNLALGHGIVFNPGEHAYVSTSPAWVMLLAAGRFVVGDTALAAQMLGTLFEGLLVLSMVRYAGDGTCGKAAGAFAGILLLTNPVFLLTSASGMELPFSLCLLVLNAFFLHRGRFAVASTLGALSLWARFDGIVVLGATVALCVWLQRADLRTRPVRVVRSLWPAAAGFAAYILFGTLLFDSWIPMSVRRKALAAPALFSAEWVSGAFGIAKEFGKAVVGQSSYYWYTETTPFVLLPLFAAIGIVQQIVKKDTTLVPLAVLTAAHVLSYLGSGSSYTTNFPWYFAPVLPAVTLAGGVGLTWLTSAVSEVMSAPRKDAARHALQAMAMAGWAAIAFGAVDRDGAALERKFTNERERVYASAAVWAGHHLGKGGLVAANEIGAVGFFLPLDVSVLDMFGLVRTESTVGENYVTLVRREKPEWILTLVHFSYKKAIEEALGKAYFWYQWKSLCIGVRRDRRAELAPRLREMSAISKTLRLDREYPWGQAASAN